MKRPVTNVTMKRMMAALTAGAMLLSTGAGFAQKARKSAATAKTPAKAAPTATAPRTATEFGYVAGYNDGYTSGKTDFNTSASRDYQRSTLYQEANRGYEMRYGSLPEFQGGYRLGYELGYSDGYHGRESNTKIPANTAAIVRATQNAMSNMPQANAPQSNNTQANNSQANNSANPTGNRAPVAASPANRPRTGGARAIPADTVVKLRLNDEINTKVNREGDRFTATIMEPGEWAGATVEGHIAKLKRSGRLTGQTELGLDFDRLTINGRTYQFNAQVERIFATEQVKTVDEEGNVQTGSNTKDTTVRSAGGAALGAVIGAIAGGGKGAAIGAILGAGVGAGSVYVQGNKDLIFERGTEMEVRTFGPRQ